MGRPAAKSSWHSLEEFAEMAGFHAGLGIFHREGFIKWTNTATQMNTGGVHGLSCRVEKDVQGNPEITLRHWAHWPGGKKPGVLASLPAGSRGEGAPFLTLRTETRQGVSGETEIRPVEVLFNGKSYTDPIDLDRFMRFQQEVAKEMWRNIARNYISQEGLEETSGGSVGQYTERQLSRRDDIPNLYQIVRTSGLNRPLNLAGMYYNGEFSFDAPARASAPPSYPRELLYAMLGLTGTMIDHGGDKKSFSKSCSISNPKGGYDGITYGYAPDAENGFRLSCNVWMTNSKGIKEQTEIYSIGFAPDSADADKLVLKDISMLPDERFSVPDIKDHKGVARAIKAMKFIHMAILQGEMPMVSDILYQHDLKSFLRQPKPPAVGPENPRTLLQVFGANKTAVLTEKELGIGSNGAVLIRDFMKQGQWVRQGIGIDWGVTFGDPEKSYYHTIAPNFGRYVQHPAAPHIKPDVNTILSLETHEHEDHLRGVARLIKFGFAMPPMVMNQHTYNTLRNMMREEKVSLKEQESVLGRCHVVDVREAGKAQNPLEKKTFSYGDTVIEQYAEEIWSESEQRKKYFPVMDVYTKDHPEAKTHVRIGPAGHSAHALMFEVEGVLYTGDYKLDQTLPADVRTDIDWLTKCREGAVHIQECTNATKKASHNVSAETVHGNRKALIKQHAGQRILADMIGSNAIDIANFCETLGEAAQEMKGNGTEYIIFAGAANQKKYRDLNQTHAFKKHMKEAYGIKTLNIGSKTAQALLSGTQKDSYAIIMTGTQDEPLSVTHRVSRGLHPTIIPNAKDVFLRLQSPIPVGDNIRIREAQNARLRHDYGATLYDAGEEARKGNDIYHSSHASQDDYRLVHKITAQAQEGKSGSGLLKILHHGGPDQLDALKKIMEEEGGRAIIPDPQSVYEINRNAKDVSLAAEVCEERVGYREIRDDAAEFYKKQRQQATVIRVKDNWHGKAAEAIQKLEKNVRERMESRTNHRPTDRGANISDGFNELSGVPDFSPIGIYHPSVTRPYQENGKNIRFFIGMDAETMGANPERDLHTSSSFVAADKDGKIVAEKSLHHALPPYLMATAGALCVTGNKKPQDLHRKDRRQKRFDLREYSFNLFNIYRKWPQELAGQKDARAAFVGFRNTVFDDLITMRMLGMSLSGTNLKPMATHGNLQVDVFNLYSVFLALRPDVIGHKKDADGNYIRTLETACKTNGVDYHDGHNDLNDAKFTLDLFFKLKAIDPDITEQMLMNADFSASRASPMIDQILGQNLHPNDQAPVFGYVDRRDRRCRPRIGGLVTVDTKVSKATDAIVLDLAKADPYALEKLSDQKLLEAMNDPDGPFSIVKMNQSAMWFPPQFIFRDRKVRAAAAGRAPKTTILQRANALKQLRDISHDVGKSFMQRVQDLYPKSALCRTGGILSQKPANDNDSALAFRTPNQKISAIFHVIKGVNQTKSRYWAEAAKLLRTLQPREDEFSKPKDSEILWKNAIKTIKDISGRAQATQGKKDYYIEDIRFLIEWQADNINSRWLAKEDRIRINALKSAWVQQSVRNFVREIEKIESDPALFEKMVGKDDGAKDRWAEMKKTYLSYADALGSSKKYEMTQEKQEIVNACRRDDPLFRMG